MSDPITAVGAYISSVMQQPVDRFWLSRLESFDSAQFQFVMASPKAMLHGGDLSFVVGPEGVRPGSRATFERVVRVEGLRGAEDTSAIERVVSLFFLLAEVGMGAADEPITAKWAGEQWQLSLTATHAQTLEKRSYQLRIGPDGTAEWEVLS